MNQAALSRAEQAMARVRFLKFFLLVMVRPRYGLSLLLKHNTRKELANVLIQGVPVPGPHPEPHCVSNLTSEIFRSGLPYEVIFMPKT